MRKILVDAIKGNEILARDIYTDMDTILMSAGVKLKKEYVQRLRALKIEYIYVEDDFARGVRQEEIIELQIKEQCQETVKQTLRKFAYCGDAKLEKLQEVAEEVIFDLLEQPEIMFNIEGVRQKSEGVYSHSLNVCTLSVFVALHLKLSKEKVKEIGTGSLLHDIGISYLPFEYRDKAYHDFTEKELKEIKKHVIYGYSAIEKESWLSTTAKNIVLSHHERLDGSGYPFRVKGDKIPIETRIVAVCDEFDRLVYGNFARQMKVHEAIEYIVAQSGIQYDKNIIRIFNESIAAFPNGTMVVTNEDEIGIVLSQNKGLPTRPTLRMIKDKYGNGYEKWIEKNLTQELTTFIKDTIEIV